jgi:hypothetical protein
MTIIDRRLRRSAAALGDTGVEILEWLHEPEQRAALIKAAETGLPSVAGISKAFVAKFKKDTGKTMVIRQFVGRAVKNIMEDAGYEPADTGVKLSDDPVFRTGTRYRSRNEQERDDDENPLLERFVAILNVAELRQLKKLVHIAVSSK